MFIPARDFASVQDVVPSLRSASRGARNLIVDGLDELGSGVDRELVASMDRAAGSASLLVTSRWAESDLPPNWRLIVMEPWGNETIQRAVMMRLQELDAAVDVDALYSLLERLGARRPVQVVGAAEAFIRGGLAAAERWLSGGEPGEPELMLVEGAAGRVAVARAVRMPESLLLTPTSERLRAAPLVTLGRASRDWSGEIAELEDLINDAAVKEQDLQRFFERNPNFLTGIEYDRVVPHPVLARDGDGPLIPDFMLDVTGAHADVLDLKLPTAPLVTGAKDRRHFGRAVRDALAQVREYGAYFDIPANRESVQQRYGLLAYRPQLTVVIGRTPALDDPLQLRRLWDDRPPGSKVITYDDLLQNVKRLEQARRR
ncbi:DUF4263 domain-containing protein [Pedococcus bigeumensis]|uniref:DUF4263 domain-containing protein n=1 Tax=Pedococcus bigeumensis TaxID=433644 RepID=A0A502CK03_9MICO|nr:DUF4263 domain-containing protein [Pedococcus bigeumensis]